MKKSITIRQPGNLSFITDPDLTIRQAAEQIYTPECSSKWTIRTVAAMCSAWEKITPNPLARNITAQMVEQFDTDLAEIGLSPETCRTYRDHLQAILNKVRFKEFATRRTTKGSSDLPTEIDGTLLSYFELLYKKQRLLGKSPSTVRKFRIAIRQFGRVLKRTPMLADLTDQNIIDLMAWMEGRGRSPETCNNMRAKLVALWGFLAKKRFVESWPDVMTLDEPEQTPQAWSEAQLGKLFKALSEQRGTVAGLPAADWWLTLHWFLLNTAERINAALTLSPADVDLESAWVRVRAKNRKGKTRDRSYRLDPDTRRAVQAFIDLNPKREFVWPFTATRETIWNRYEAILKAAGLPFGRESKFHRMRKTALSYFKANGGDATQLADHASPATTRRHYLDPTICPEAQACDVLASVLKNTRQAGGR